MKIISVLLIIISSLISGEMTYSPQNPSFGGNSFNAQWLMSNAQAQNNYKEPREDEASFQKDMLESFEESLNRQVLSRLSREVIAAAFGESGDAEFTEGTYQIGDYRIEIDPEEMDVIKILILDELTGNSTKIEVPYYDTQTGE